WKVVSAAEKTPIVATLGEPTKLQLAVPPTKVKAYEARPMTTRVPRRPEMQPPKVGSSGRYACPTHLALAKDGDAPGRRRPSSRQGWKNKRRERSCLA